MLQQVVERQTLAHVISASILISDILQSAQNSYDTYIHIHLQYLLNDIFYVCTFFSML